MVYVSERLTNIGELESMIGAALQTEEELCCEMEKARASIDRIDTLACRLHSLLQQAKEFELCVERRKTVCADASSDLL
ncbi:MAG: hypothetical protein LUC30_01265 [Clostridiales bacterium]|nr:hypothetical protein [Clostridiales bacterium]